MIVVELHLSIDTRLFPEYRNRPSNLQVWETVIVDKYQLFCLTEVCHMPFVIESSFIVASPSLFPGPSSY